MSKTVCAALASQTVDHLYCYPIEIRRTRQSGMPPIHTTLTARRDLRAPQIQSFYQILASEGAVTAMGL
jgi:hypothetical protein